MVRLNKPRINLDKRGGIDLGKKRNPNHRNPREGNWRPPGFIPVEDPPEGLTPIGGGFEVTPNRPIDPRECNLYSNSPYCGGNPWTTMPVGFDWEILQDECAIGIRLIPIAGFTKMPDINIVWRNPDPSCQPPPPYTKPPPPGKPKFPNLNPDQLCYCVVEHGMTTYNLGWTATGEQVNYGIYSIYFSKINMKLGGDVVFDEGLNNPLQPEIEFEAKLFTKRQNYRIVSTGFGTHTYEPTDIESWTDTQSGIGFGSAGSPTVVYYSETGYGNQEIVPFPELTALQLTETQQGYTVRRSGWTGNIIFGRWGDIEVYLNALYESFETHHAVSDFIDYSASFYLVLVDGPDREKKIPPPSPGSPPPPPPPPMRCCPVPRQNDELLRLLIQKVDKLSKVVGVEEWDSPATVPQTMIVEDGQAAGNISIANLSKFLEWAVVSLHDKLGEFEIKIDIDDQDPLEEGDQPKTVKLPTLAETVAEMFVMNFDTAINSQVLMNMATRLLLEQTQIKNIAYTDYYMTRATAAYLGFPTKDEEKELPLAINPEAETLSRMLVETKQKTKVPVADFQTSMQGVLTELNQAAAIIRGRYFLPLKDGISVASQIKDLIMDAKDSAEKTGKAGDDLDEFIREVERGHANSLPDVDPTNPYGGAFGGRIKLRRVRGGEEETTGGTP